MRWLACFWAAAALALAQSGALLKNQEALKLEQRTAQLMESTGLVVPGLARASGPALEDARQALANLQAAPQNALNTNAFLATARAYLAIADTIPKPYPFPEEGRRQFVELRENVDRLDSHFRALLEMKEAQLRDPDRDELKRYAEDDQKLPPPSPERPRVVFLGDSITDGWRLKEYYGSDRDFVNRGISGQITGEMLGRMKADVIDLKPKMVVVLAGTNDLARGVPVSTIENNLSMIADLAEAHHIQPVFASILPVSDYHKDANPQYMQSKRRPPAQIVEINNWLKETCRQRHFTYVDYYSALVDQNGFLQADASDDGLHPNGKGYRIMAPIALAAIDGVLNAEARPVKGKKGRTAADVQRAEAQKAEAQKAEAQKAEARRVEAEKAQALKAEEQKARAQKAEAQKTEAQKAEAQKAEARQSQAQQSEQQKAEAKKARDQKAEARKAEARKAEEQKAEARQQQARKQEEAKAEARKAAEQKAAAKAADKKAAAQKTAEQKAAEQKTADAKKTDEKGDAKKEKKKSGIRAWLEKDHK